MAPGMQGVLACLLQLSFVYRCVPPRCCSFVLLLSAPPQKSPRAAADLPHALEHLECDLVRDMCELLLDHLQRRQHAHEYAAYDGRRARAKAVERSPAGQQRDEKVEPCCDGDDPAHEDLAERQRDIAQRQRHDGQFLHLVTGLLFEPLPRAAASSLGLCGSFAGEHRDLLGRAVVCDDCGHRFVVMCCLHL
ncbi:hypothetical protein JKP88DRAFT_223167 [Tribonema minus]|uniref:Secreted protein n=1 Tax=Tribonema minus TaxID=303371 RepID=A0A835Z1C0_9STRA|nr:hypothetical protein JKP88DRAFT_223167 [Tribonema minus]